MENRKRSNNLQGSDDESQSQLITLDVASHADHEGDNIVPGNDFNVVEPVSNSAHDDNEDTDDVVVNTCALQSRLSNAPPRKQKKIDIGSIIQRSIEQREERAKERALERKKFENSTLPNDPLFHFFMSMYQTTLQMPPASQHFIRSKVFEVVSQTEASLMEFSPPEIPHPHSQAPLLYNPQNDHLSPPSFNQECVAGPSFQPTATDADNILINDVLR